MASHTSDRNPLSIAGKRNFRSAALRGMLISLCVPLILIFAAAGQDQDASARMPKLAGSGQMKRTVLKREQLLRGTDSSKPVDNTAGFALPSQAAEPTESFEGTLTLKDVSSNGHFNLLSDIFHLVPSGNSPWKHLPSFRFQFVQSGSFLVPVDQGLTITGDPAWNYILGTGRVWRESADAGYMRAALPFALVQRNQNCVHNGAMTFLFSTTRSPRVSHALLPDHARDLLSDEVRQLGDAGGRVHSSRCGAGIGYSFAPRHRTRAAVAGEIL